MPTSPRRPPVLCTALFLLAIVGCDGEDSSPADSPTADASTADASVADASTADASTSDASTADNAQARARCIADHARGADPIADPANLMDALSTCNGDSGECTANVPCTGTAADRICDASQLITADAAICIARSHGLPPGISPARAGLGYNYKHRRIIWSVSVVLSRSSPDAGPGSFREEGLSWAVDAVTGAILDQFGFLTIA